MIVRKLGKKDYLPVYQDMESFTLTRNENTQDELWVLEHPSLFTQGMAGKPEHLLVSDSGIPVVKVDRGGQITYHGPGQLIIYTLIAFKQKNLSVRELVRILENAIIATLGNYGINAHGDVKAPGVYVGEEKIASLGLRIRNGCVYHGLSLNINMDLAPFTFINPCGYQGLRVTQLANLVENCPSVDEVAEYLVSYLQKMLPETK